MFLLYNAVAIPPFGGIADTFLTSVPSNFFYGGVTDSFQHRIPPFWGISILFYALEPQQTFPYHLISYPDLLQHESSLKNVAAE